jgi:hypothetical protein
MRRIGKVNGSHKWSYEDYKDGDILVEGEVSFTATPGTPGSHYKRNGDPGDPPEPPEVEFYDETITKIVILGVELVLGHKEKLKPLAETCFAKIDQDELINHILADHCEPDEPEYDPE